MIDFSKIDPKDCFMVNPIEKTRKGGWIDISPYHSWDEKKSEETV